MFYYRDNLFRLYGLSNKLRDVAKKGQLAQSSYLTIHQEASVSLDLHRDPIPRPTTTYIPRGATSPSRFWRCGDNWIKIYRLAKALRV